MTPSTQRVLRLLQENESVTTHDLLVGGCGSRYSARIFELRAMGYRIDEKRLPLPTRGSSYRLVAEPEEDLVGRRESRRSPGQAASERATKGSSFGPAAPVAQQGVTGLFDDGEFAVRDHWRAA